MQLFNVISCVILNLSVIVNCSTSTSGKESRQLFNFRRQGELSGRRDRPCTTPTGGPGLCQDVTNCPALLLDLGTLVRSICFQSLFMPGTCCPQNVPTNEATTSAISTTTSRPASTKKQSGFKKVTSSKRKKTTTTTAATTARTPTTTKIPFKKKKTTRKPPTTTIRTTTTKRRTTTTPPSPQIPANPSPSVDGILKPPPLYPISANRPNRPTNVKRYECGRPKVTQARVVNGTESYPGQWPWMAAIFLHGYITKEFHCGGSIISREYIVTAAHCMIDKRGRRYSPSQFSILLGDYDLASADPRLDKYIKSFKVESINMHPNFENYNHQYFKNDIALLKLSRPIDFSPFILPVCLPSKAMASANIDALSGEISTVIGYGRTSYSGPQSKKLLKAQMPVWWNQACDDAYFPPILDTNVCAGYVEGGIDSCQGDSGGPLLIYRHGKWILLGIVSFGQKCAEPGYPGVYTRVPKYLDWLIRNAVK